MTYANIYYICIGVRPSSSCTWCLVIQCWRRLYDENWKNIYSVSVVGFFISFCFFYIFRYR